MGNCLNAAGRPRGDPPSQRVRLSRRSKGPDVILAAGGLNISGSGSIISAVPIVQDRVLFEARLVRRGGFCIGIASEDAVFSSSLFQQPNAWIFSSDNGAITFGQGESVPLESPPLFAVGDVITCAYDQESIRLYHNGALLKYNPPLSIKKLRGLVHAGFSVSSSAQLEVAFREEDIRYPQQGFSSIMIERTMM